MKIVQKKINQLIPADYNPRFIKDKDFEHLKKSLSNFDIVEPAIINVNPERKNIIVGGHQRIKVAKELGYEQFPCVEVDLTIEKEKELNIRLNKNTGEFDFDILKEEFEKEDLIDFGFENEELFMFDEDVIIEGLTDEDSVPDIPEEPKTKLGDIYKLGNHRLMCGDSTNIDAVEKLMDGENADMLFTDPPYNVAFNGRSGKHDVIENDDLSVADFNDFINEFINIVIVLNIPNRYIWCNWKFFAVLHGELEYTSCIVWAKNVFGMGNNYRHQHEFCLFHGAIDKEIKNESDLWNIARDSSYVHPTQKPTALAERAIGNHKKSKIILDLFGGSGSTMIACEKTGRKARLMELDPKYCDVIVKRWEDFTGKKAELING